MSNGFLNLINRDGINYWVTEDVSLLVPGANGDLLSVVNGKAAWITQSSILDTFVTAVTASSPLASSGGLTPNISIVPGAEGTFLKVVGGVATWAAGSTIATFTQNSAVGPALTVTDTNPANSDNPIATFYSSTGNGATVKMGTSDTDNVRFKYDGGVFTMEVVPYTGPAPFTAAQLFINSNGSVNGPRAFECEEFHLYRSGAPNYRDRSFFSTTDYGLVFTAEGNPTSNLGSFKFTNSDNTASYLTLNNLIYNVVASGSTRLNSLNTSANKLLTLFDNAPTDPVTTATNFVGFGANSVDMRLQVPNPGSSVNIYSGVNRTLLFNEVGSTANVQTEKTTLQLVGATNIKLSAPNVLSTEGANQNYIERLNALSNNYIVTLGTEIGAVSGTYTIQQANVVKIGRMVNLSIRMECNVTGYPGGSTEWRLNFPSVGFPQFYNQDQNWGPMTPNSTFANTPLMQYYLQATTGTTLRVNQYNANAWGTPSIGTPLTIRVIVSFSYISN